MFINSVGIIRENELNLVFNVARTCKPLTNEQIAKLQAVGDYGTIVKHNLKFAVSVAHCYKVGGAVSISDLVTEASIGLLEASKLFNPALNNSFTTFAVNYIRKYIYHFLAQNAKTVRIIDANERKANRYNAISMDSPTTDDEHCTVADTFSGDFHADSLTNEGDKRQYIKMLLNTLTPRERYILLSLFGIGSREKSLWEVAQDLSLTEERVRQIKFEALSKLKGLI